MVLLGRATIHAPEPFPDTSKFDWERSARFEAFDRGDRSNYWADTTD